MHDAIAHASQSAAMATTTAEEQHRYAMQAIRAEARRTHELTIEHYEHELAEALSGRSNFDVEIADLRVLIADFEQHDVRHVAELDAARTQVINARGPRPLRRRTQRSKGALPLLYSRCLSK